jgi:hypothetical protein
VHHHWKKILPIATICALDAAIIDLTRTPSDVRVTEPFARNAASDSKTIQKAFRSGSDSLMSSTTNELGCVGRARTKDLKRRMFAIKFVIVKTHSHHRESIQDSPPRFVEKPEPEHLIEHELLDGILKNLRWLLDPSRRNDDWDKGLYLHCFNHITRPTSELFFIDHHVHGKVIQKYVVKSFRSYPRFRHELEAYQRIKPYDYYTPKLVGDSSITLAGGQLTYQLYMTHCGYPLSYYSSLHPIMIKYIYFRVLIALSILDAKMSFSTNDLSLSNILLSGPISGIDGPWNNIKTTLCDLGKSSWRSPNGRIIAPQGTIVSGFQADVSKLEELVMPIAEFTSDDERIQYNDERRAFFKAVRSSTNRDVLFTHSFMNDVFRYKIPKKLIYSL